MKLSSLAVTMVLTAATAGIFPIMAQPVTKQLAPERGGIHVKRRALRQGSLDSTEQKGGEAPDESHALRHGRDLQAPNNYCGTDWVSAAKTCGKACPGGLDGECPVNQHCFGGITSCSGSGSSGSKGLPCGGGDPGSGLCTDASLCCSEYGWCGTTQDHCNTATCYSSPSNTCTRDDAVLRPAAPTRPNPSPPNPSPPSPRPPVGSGFCGLDQARGLRDLLEETIDSSNSCGDGAAAVKEKVDVALGVVSFVANVAELFGEINDLIDDFVDTAKRLAPFTDKIPGYGSVIRRVRRTVDTIQKRFEKVLDAYEGKLDPMKYKLGNLSEALETVVNFTKMSSDYLDRGRNVVGLSVSCSERFSCRLANQINTVAGNVPTEPLEVTRVLFDTCGSLLEALDGIDVGAGLPEIDFLVDMVAFFKNMIGSLIEVSDSLMNGATYELCCNNVLRPFNDIVDFFVDVFNLGTCWASGTVAGVASQGIEAQFSLLDSVFDETFNEFFVSKFRTFLSVVANLDSLEFNPVVAPALTIDDGTCRLGFTLDSSVEIKAPKKTNFDVPNSFVSIEFGGDLSFSFKDIGTSIAEECTDAFDALFGDDNEIDCCDIARTCDTEHRIILREDPDCGGNIAGTLPLPVSGFETTKKTSEQQCLANDEATSMELIGPLSKGLSVEFYDTGTTCSDDYTLFVLEKDLEEDEVLCVPSLEFSLGENSCRSSFDNEFSGYRLQTRTDNKLNGKISTYVITNPSDSDDTVSQKCFNEPITFYEGNACTQSIKGWARRIPDIGEAIHSSSDEADLDNDEARSVKLVGPIPAGVRVEVGNDKEHFCDDDYASIVVTQDILEGEEYCVCTFEQTQEFDKLKISFSPKGLPLDGKVSQFAVTNLGSLACRRSGVVLNQCTEQTFQCPSQPGSSCLGDAFLDSLSETLASEFNLEIFLAQAPDPHDPPFPSTVYKFEDFISAVKNLQNAGRFGLWLGDDCTEESQKVALVNIAAFLGQAMRETIIYDACDENNWDKWRADVPKEDFSPPELLSYLYPMSSGCGQLGQKYADYPCDEDACEQDLSMEITGTTNADWIGAPPPLFCGPRSKYDGLGYWNPHKLCRGPDGSCEGEPFHYDGQTAGIYVPVTEDDHFPNYYYSNPLPDENGNSQIPRTSDAFPATNVEGCCWWGRGVIQTTGRCNFGKLNKYLGAGAGGNALYPEINFCKNPQAVCEGPSDLKWVAGIFFWVSDVGPQDYNEQGFSFRQGVLDYVEQGCADDPDKDGCNILFEYASGIVNRGCHNPGEIGCPGCTPGATCDPAHNIPERVDASKKALKALMKHFGDGRTPPSPSPPTNNYCGGGNVNSKLCANASLCCSAYGWCDSTQEHCDPNTCFSNPSNTCKREGAVARSVN